MRKNFNVIKISGFKGIFIALFIVGCLIAGFLTFPGWVCMHLWNFTAGYFSQMPQMNLVHGILLWCIFALSAYALNHGNFAISFGGPPPSYKNEQRIKEILKQVNEKNASILPVDKLFDDKEPQNELIDENDDKINK